MKQKMFNKFEFSKLILIIIYVTSVIFSLIAAYLLMMGVDIGAFAPVVLAMWAQLGTSSGFYYWKAKSENKIKLLKSVPESLAAEAKDLLDDNE